MRPDKRTGRPKVPGLQTLTGMRRAVERSPPIAVAALSSLGHSVMRTDETFLQLQRAQAQLRLSIEKSKQLAAESDRLLERHRQAAARPTPPNPAWF